MKHCILPLFLLCIFRQNISAASMYCMKNVLKRKLKLHFFEKNNHTFFRNKLRFVLEMREMLHKRKNKVVWNEIWQAFWWSINFFKHKPHISEEWTNLTHVYYVLLPSLNSDRRRFVTMWRYNLDDAFHGAVKAYTKHQKLLDFWILSTKMSKKIVENGPQCFIPRELVIFEFFLFELVRYSAA